MSRKIRLTIETSRGLERAKNGRIRLNQKDSYFSGIKEAYVDIVEGVLDDLQVKHSIKDGEYFIEMDESATEGLTIPVELSELTSSRNVGDYWVASTFNEQAYGMPDNIMTSYKPISKLRLISKIFQSLADHPEMFTTTIELDVEMRNSEVEVFAHNNVIVFKYGDDSVKTLGPDSTYDDDKVYKLLFAYDERMQK